MRQRTGGGWPIVEPRSRKARRAVNVQLWSYNYDPEPQGIGPLSTTLAQRLTSRGHEVLVVAAHPHYPEPAWGTRRRPYREERDGVPIVRLPLWIGRDSGRARLRQEFTFALSQGSAAPLLPPCDVIIAVTPCFPALLPAMITARTRRIPWIMWLQDIVTDGAVTTGLLNEQSIPARAARRLEVAAYNSASRIVVISDEFRRNLVRKGVDPAKIVRIFNPSSRHADAPNDMRELATRPPRILAMGNIGYSQGLESIVDAFQSRQELMDLEARLVIAGSGVAAEDVRARVRSDAVEMPGVLYGADLEPELRGATVGLVSQRADVAEFNLPSKLMNYMAYGIPVVASVRVGSETAHIVEESGAGWVTDASDPAQFARTTARVLQDPDALEAAGLAGFEFANEEFHPNSVAQKFEDVLISAVEGHGRRDPAAIAEPDGQAANGRRWSRARTETFNGRPSR
jgi:colanic acid biosynthesis glycosyl transferase WcaI